MTRDYQGIILPNGGNTKTRKTKMWMENAIQDLVEKDMDMRTVMDTNRD